MGELQERIDNAIEELKEYLKENPESTDSDIGDQITEIADSSVPVYNSAIIECGNEDHSIVTNVPECGPAFDGTPTPINIMAANIFERLESELWDAWKDWKAKKESEEEE